MVSNSVINQAKDVSIVDYLASRQILPVRQIGAQLVYLSPLSREHTASFFVHPVKNVFNCFSTGERGDVIRLVRLLTGCAFGEALHVLQSFQSPTGQHQTPLYLPVSEEETGVQVLNVRRLENRALLTYVRSRKVSENLAQTYLKEMHFRVLGQKLFALAFANDNGGYELRNAFYKGCAVTKAVTTIPGSSPQGAVNIFEGCFSYLSALQFYRLNQFRNDTVVLNSLLLLDTQYSQYLLNHYHNFYMFLDNNRPGWKKAIEFRQLLQRKGRRKQLANCSGQYRGYSDFNSFLTDRTQEDKVG